MEDQCAICGCKLNHEPNVYAEDTTLGRSHATKHHYVAERFFGRSRKPILKNDHPWKLELEGHDTGSFCYDCHEELLHNPVLLPAAIKGFAKLVKRRKLAEESKPDSKEKLKGRIELLQEVIATGVNELLKNNG